MIKFKALGGGLMPGKATRPDDGRHNNRGTVGNKGNTTKIRTGRPKGSVSERGQRGIHQIRAYDDEWDVIKAFIQLVREDVTQCKTAVALLETSIRQQ